MECYRVLYCSRHLPKWLSSLFVRKKKITTATLSNMKRNKGCLYPLPHVMESFQTALYTSNKHDNIFLWCLISKYFCWYYFLSQVRLCKHKVLWFCKPICNGHRTYTKYGNCLLFLRAIRRQLRNSSTTSRSLDQSKPGWCLAQGRSRVYAVDVDPS